VDVDIILEMCDASVFDGCMNMHVHLIVTLTVSLLISVEMWGKFSHVQKNCWHT